MSTLITSTETHNERHFSSVGEFAEYLKATPRQSKANNYACSARPKESWDLGLGFNAALECASNGGYWKEGADKLQALSTNDAFDASRYTHTEEIELDVVGGAIDTGEYLAGAPDCFMRIEETLPTKKIIRIDVETGSAARVDAPSLLRRGRAVLAVVDAIEMMGYSVELRAAYVAGDADRNAIVFIDIKKAADTWCPANVAFALAHPAFSRRLGFGYSETLGKGLGAYITCHGYGDGYYSESKKAVKGTDIYIPFAINKSDFKTDECAMATIIGAVNKQVPNLLKSV
jgi:hypothetical protein